MKADKLKLSMTSKMILFSAIFATVALLMFVADAQETNEDDILCSQDENTRQSVLKCITLMPSVHLEVIKECDSRFINVDRNEHEKLLNIYCSEDFDENYKGVGTCMTKAFETRGIDVDELAAPVTECLKELVSTNR